MSTAMERNDEDRRATFQFIDEVHNNPCIWDISSPVYKDKHLKQKVLEEIATKLGLKGEEEMLSCVVNMLKTPPPSEPPQSYIDDNDLFGKVVTSHMRKIPDGRVKELLKLKVQQMLVETQFQEDSQIASVRSMSHSNRSAHGASLYTYSQPMTTPSSSQAGNTFASIQRSPLRTLSIQSTQRSPLQLSQIIDSSFGF